VQLNLDKAFKNFLKKGIIKSVTISKNTLTHYFASILCEEEIEELSKTNKNIGIDLGIKEKTL